MYHFHNLTTTALYIKWNIHHADEKITCFDQVFKIIKAGGCEQLFGNNKERNIVDNIFHGDIRYLDFEGQHRVRP